MNNFNSACILLVIMFFLIAGCASSPSVIEEDEKNKTLTELEQFGLTSKTKKKKIKNKILEITKTKKIQKDNLEVKNNKGNKNLNEDLNRIQNSTNINTHKAKEIIEKKLVPKINTFTENEDEANNLETNSKLDYELTKGEKYYQDFIKNSSNTKKDKQKLSDFDLSKMCNEKYVSFRSYNSFTKLIDRCNWNLPKVLKINQIKSPKDFKPNQQLILPSEIFILNENNNNDNQIQFDTNYSCKLDYDNISQSGKLSYITQKCGWDRSKILEINQIISTNITSDVQLTVLLPNGVQKLLKTYSRNSKHYPARPIKNQTLNSNKGPTWCFERNYIIDSIETIETIANKCKINKVLLAKLNQSSVQSELSLGQIILLPNSFQKKVRKKVYKIPLQTNVCKKSYYKIQQGINLGKIASTCQWDVKLLLEINNLQTQSIIKIGQVITLPNAFYIDSAVINYDDNDSKSDEMKITDYSKLCNKNIYKPLPKDNLRDLARTCGWSLQRILSINFVFRDFIPNLLPDNLLLPPSINKQIKQLKSRKITKNSKPKDSKNIVALCTQKEIMLPRKANLSMVASSCGWDLNYLKLLNNNHDFTKDKSKPLVLPPSIYENFGKIKEWSKPLKVINKYRIDKETKGLFLYAPSNEKVYNVQKGFVLLVQQSDKTGLFQVFIRHSEGYVSLYENLSNISVSSGEILENNHIIGNLGTERNPEFLKFTMFKDAVNISVLNTIGSNNL